MRCREAAWGDCEKRAELRILGVPVKKSAPWLGPRERAGFQCWEDEAGAGIPRRGRGLQLWVEMQGLRRLRGERRAGQK